MALKVWFPLNGVLENKGCSGITLTGTPNAWNDGKIGKCAYWNGSISNILYNNTTELNYTNNFSVCFWANPVYTGSTTQYAWTIGRADAGGYGYGFQITNATTANFRFGNGVYSIATPSNEWHHYTMTVGNNKVTTYKDGIQVNSYNLPGTLPTYSDGNGMGLGCFHYASGNIYPYYGSLNDFRVYDHCLSTAEIKEISQGLVLHYKLDSQYSESTTNLITSIGYCSRITIDNNKAYIDWSTNAGDTYIFFNTSEAMSTSNIYSFSFQCEGLSPSEENTISFGWANLGGNYRIFIHNGWNKLENFSPPSNELRTFFDDYDRNTTAKFELYNFQLEKKDHATGFVGYGVSNIGIIQDSSGYGHNAVSNGSVLLMLDQDTPRYNYSTKFTAGARIATTYASSTFMPTDMLTVNIWFKSSAAANRFLSCTEGGGFNFESDSGYVRFPLFISGKGYTLCTSSTMTWSTLSDNKWHMITATYDRTASKIYIDGQLDTTTNSSYPNINIGYNANTPFTLGAEAQTIASPLTGGYTGSLSDCRIYCTALSADDIKALYNIGASVDNKGKLHTFEIIEKQGNESNAKFVNSSASSVIYDEKTDTYTIVSPVGTSGWGYGVRLADTPALWVPYGKAYRWTAEVFTPVALGVQTDYNNTASTTWNGNDNDLVSARLESYDSIPANTWTKIVRGAINTNTNNTSQLPIRDYSSLGLVTNGQSDSITWKVRNLQWYILDSTFETEIKKQGQVKSSHISETNFNKFEISKKVQSIEADELIEY